MDVNTFFLLYGGIKAYTMFLSDCFMGNSKVSDFILKEDYFYMAKFSLAMCSLFVVKEELIEGSKNNFICKTIDEGILNCVKEVAVQTKDGFEIDGVIFKNPEEIVGLIRNKLAHGEFIIDLENKKISFKLENCMMSLGMSSVINMISKSIDCYYLNSSNTEYKNDIVVMNKPDKNRTKSLKTKSEIKGFLRTFSKMSFSFEKRDGGALNDEIIKIADGLVTSAYEANSSIGLLVKAKKKFANQGYSFDWKKTPLKEDLIEEITDYVYYNYPKNMPYEHQIRFMKKDLESRLNPKKHLVESLKKNMIILQIAYENQTVNYGKVLEEYKTVCSYDTIGLEELATTSFALFEAIFSYGNDKFLENSNEYTFIPSDGLDYSTLDLTTISSIIKIRDCKKENEPMTVEWNDENIKINLSTSDYKIYCRYSEYCIPIVNSMIIIPSIMFVLDQIASDDNDINDIMDKKWYRVLSKKIGAATGKDFNLNYVKVNGSFEIIQKLFDMPIHDAMKEIEIKYGGENK